MKILLITDLYPVKEEEVTTPRTLYNFVKGWRALGHEVLVVKPNFILNSFLRGKPFYKTGWYDDVYNVNYFLPFCGSVRNKIEEVYKKNFHPDIVLAHMPSGILFADKLNIPFVAGVHCSDIEVLTNPLYSMYFKGRLKQALYNSHAIACRSSVLQSRLLSYYPELSGKTFAAPSGIDEDYIIKDFTHDIRPERLKVVTCANFKKRKNIDKVILGLKDFEGVELTVIGDGPGRSYLQRLDRSVKFTGRITHDKVLKIMRSSDVFILPSDNETFGMVYLEAMASGCITICKEHDGIDGIIKTSLNGFTVKATPEHIRELFTLLTNSKVEVLRWLRKQSVETARQYTRLKCCDDYLKKVMYMCS